MKFLRAIVWTVAGILAPVFERSGTARAFLRNARFPGRGTLVTRLRGHRLPRTSVVIRCDGLLFDLDIRDDVQRSIYFNAYDRSDLEAALSHITVGGTCLDVGANVGFYTLHFANRVGPRGRVHAFEPDTRLADLIEKNCALNGFADFVTVHRVAVSNSEGTARFYTSVPGHSGWGSLVEFEDIAGSAIEVRTVTLDSIFAEHGISTVDLMKMDVEANEFEALAGASRTLSEQRIRTVLIEFNGIRLSERGRTLDEMLALFTRAGYQPVESSPAIIAGCRSGATDPASICLNLVFTAAASAPPS